MEKQNKLHMGHIAEMAINSKKMSVEEVAGKIGISRNMIYHNLRSSTVKAERMEQIADAIGIPTKKMFEIWLASVNA